VWAKRKVIRPSMISKNWFLPSNHSSTSIYQRMNQIKLGEKFLDPRPLEMCSARGLEQNRTKIKRQKKRKQPASNCKQAGYNAVKLLDNDTLNM
jgi:hypothetical protein